MRRRKAEKRAQLPDVKYNSPLIGRLINTILCRGKKSTAQRIVYGALDLIAGIADVAAIIDEPTEDEDIERHSDSKVLAEEIRRKEALGMHME